MTQAMAARSIDGDNPAHAERLRIRSGAHRGHTCGLAPGYVQANLAIMPAADAQAFQTFCQLNPKPCPMLAIGAPGDPHLPTLGADLDLRTDLSGYRVFRDGEDVDVTDDITKYWRDDLVSFPLGCSLSFEEALTENDIALRHFERDELVAMYVTNIDTAAAGPFGGKLVVSMRPMKPADAIRAIQITSRFPNVHGAPIHIGLPEAIGIEDLEKPVFGGDPPRMTKDEIPVFWACGVTPQVAIAKAKPSFCITHLPGHMLITDVKNTTLAIL